MRLHRTRYAHYLCPCKHCRDVLKVEAPPLGRERPNHAMFEMEMQ